jgi:dihydroorotate dehydrogenase (fumarate)
MSKINLKTTIGTISLDSCIMNASGPKCTSKEELNNLNQSNSATIVTKSATIDYREGNSEPRYYDTPWGSINSMGLPNNGLDFYLDYFEKNKKNINKPTFLSIAGLSYEENVKMLKKIQKHEHISAVEFNLSCPNLIGKPQTAYDFERTKYVLDNVFSFYDKPLGIKLPPYFDVIHFEQIAEILNQYPLAFVTTINSIGNGLYINPETDKVVIKPKNGFGGIGGSIIKPTALANVNMLYRLLKNIPIIGVGGIQTGRDVYEHLLCGASAVQVGTQLMQEGISVFERLENELKEIMKEKEHNFIREIDNKIT